MSAMRWNRRCYAKFLNKMELSLAHNTFEAVICRRNLPVAFPITTQTPRACNVPRTKGKTSYVHCVQQHTFTATKASAGKLFSAFLRFTAAPCGDRRSLSTSTHKANNVVSGSVLAQNHSVKHYEAVDISDFIASISLVSGRKSRCNIRNYKKIA